MSFLIYGQTFIQDFGFPHSLTSLSLDDVSFADAGIYQNTEVTAEHPLSEMINKIEPLVFINSPLLARPVNVVLYATISCLVFLILSMLLDQNQWSISVMATLLFVAHPVHTEVLANLSYRAELFALFFGLLAWLGILIGSNLFKWGWLFFGVGFFTLAIVLKITMAPLALVIPLSLWFFKRGTLVYKAASFLSLASIVCVFVFLGTTDLLPWEYRSDYSVDANWSLGQIITALGYYIKLVFWPHPLSAYYGYNAVPFEGWLSASFLFYTGAFLIVLASTVWLLFRKRIGGFGLLFFVLTLIPLSNLLYPIEGLIIERGLLVPSIGICLFAASVLHWINNRSNRYTAHSIFIILLLVASGLSFGRISQWRSQEVLLNTDVSNFPASAHLLGLNGDYYFFMVPKKEGNERHELAKKSINYFLRCSKLRPDWARVHLRLGILYDRELNMPFEAIPHYERNLSLVPKSFKASFGLAGSYAQIGMQDSAVYFVKKTLDIIPEHYESLEFLTSHYFKTGNIQIGLGFVNRFIQLYPQSDVPHLILADHYFKQEKNSAAIEQLEIAAFKNPVNKETLKVLFSYFSYQKDFDKAEKYRDMAIYN